MAITRSRVRPVSELETARRALGLTQAEVAKRAGISHQYVGMIEGGLWPSERLRGAIAAIVGRDPKKLWPTSTNGGKA